MAEIAEKMYSHLILGGLVQKLIFQDGGGGHFGFGPLAKKPGTFARDLGAKFFLNGSKKSNQLSNLGSQKVVTELRFLTLLHGLYKMTL